MFGNTDDVVLNEGLEAKIILCDEDWTLRRGNSSENR